MTRQNLSEELKTPETTLPLGGFIGLVGVTLSYFLCNVAYLMLFNVEQIANTDTIAMVNRISISRVSISRVSISRVSISRVSISRFYLKFLSKYTSNIPNTILYPPLSSRKILCLKRGSQYT